MKTLFYFSAAFCLVAIGICFIVLTRDAQKAISQASEIAALQNLNLAQDEMRLNQALTTIDAAAAEQKAYWAKTSADSDKTVKALRVAVDRASLLMKHTDEQLNGSLLRDADRELVLTSTEAQKAFGSIGQSADQLSFAIDDARPALIQLQDSAAQLSIASKYVASAMGHGDKILADGEKTADYYEKKLTTPVSFAHALVNVVLDVGSKAGNIVTGFVK